MVSPLRLSLIRGLRRTPFCVAAFGFVSLAGTLPGRADQFAEHLRPVLDTQCFRCHSPEKQKGGIDLTTFKDQGGVLKGYKVWRRAIEQLETGEMPPDEDKITPEERQRLVEGLKSTLALLDGDDPSLLDPGPALIRRLSRTEYENAIRDLTGLELSVAAAVGIPEDSTGSSFENIAAALAVAPALMEKYFAAADLVLDQLFGNGSAATELKKGKANGQKDEAAGSELFRGLSPSPEQEQVAGLLARFARRAYRRPVEAEEIEKLMRVYDAAVARGDESRNALRKALKPVLVSPFFLYRVETPGTLENVPAGARPASKVGDVELASRLSFFLWSSIPDDELLALGERNELSRPEVLQAQVKRMLADPKARAFSENFFLSWLQLRKLDEARPTTEFFPTFNGRMKDTMRQEVLAFCNHLREQDRPMLELLEADYTFANADLAKHYGLNGISGKELQRVALKPEDHRGGILGMAAILAVTSHTNRTSPSQRGRWVLDVVFGTPPPPPPPNAGMFKDEGRKQKHEPANFREKLAQHAEDPTCAGCHRRMDPLGFGLDNYDAVGRWRPTSAELNTAGELPGGQRFSGAAELKKLIWERREHFMRNVIGQMLSYALGREIDYFDEREITKIRARAAESGDRFSAVIQGIVESYPFRYRRDADPKDDPTPPVNAPVTTASN